MKPGDLKFDQSRRLQIFRLLAPYFNKVLPSSFFQKTAEQVPGIERVHHLIEGIYKPAWSSYTLTVASMLKSPYADQLFHNLDRTWWIHYSPKAGGMNVSANVGLLQCMTDSQPVLVMRQESDKSHAQGARHRLLGIGFVENFDSSKDLFRIRGLEWAEVSALLGFGLSDDLIETALRLESLEDWTPFAAEDRAVYQTTREKRDTAFRSIVLDNYGYSCAITGLKFHSEKYAEADAAHIIAKEMRGTDDPRNGLALSKSIHWAFDRGIFTVSDQYEVVVHPKARLASSSNFGLMEMDRKQINLPPDRAYFPHVEALAWHKKEVFDRFEL